MSEGPEDNENSRQRTTEANPHLPGTHRLHAVSPVVVMNSPLPQAVLCVHGSDKRAR
jgi:hypothetical protein